LQNQKAFFLKTFINTLYSLIHIYIHLNLGSKSKFSYLKLMLKFIVCVCTTLHHNYIVFEM
jgi:hypothetical protein